MASGGGLKAYFFHIGVGMRLQEEGFNFKGGVLEDSETVLRSNSKRDQGNKDIELYVGSSGGSLFGMSVAMGYLPDQLLQLFQDDSKMKQTGLERGLINYIGLNSQAAKEFLKGMKRVLSDGLNPETILFPMSPLNLVPLEKRLHNFLGTEDFTRLAADLFVVTTPLNFPGRIIYCRKQFEKNEGIVYRNDATISATVAGSCSLQFLHPACIRHKNGENIDVVDGETRKTLSYKIAGDNGADLVFVSYTHVPYNFNIVRGSLKKYGIVRVAIQSIYLMIEEKILSSQKSNVSKNFAYDAVEETFERLNKELPDKKDLLNKYKETLLADLVRELDIKRNVDYVFISPDIEDDNFYFDWHLGMSKDYVERIAKKGYEAADRVLQGYEFR
ncbi:patatin-like phospholipase family protein [Candidatus Woesearchaeota archaeon]|nr:patatin-like phospholipase family protein [Candidatus Woesearchaeota archaeon]